jgi:hypothetical protein
MVQLGSAIDDGPIDRSNNPSTTGSVHCDIDMPSGLKINPAAHRRQWAGGAQSRGTAVRFF